MSKTKGQELIDPASFIRPRVLEKAQPDIKLKCVFGRRLFDIKLSNPTGQTTADLANMIYEKTNIPHDQQRIMFKGIVCDPPDTGTWAPLLSDLGLCNGDKVEVLARIRTQPDADDIAHLESLTEATKNVEKDRHLLCHRLELLLRGFDRSGSTIMALCKIRKEFEEIKEQFMVLIQELNCIKFDFRNCVSQAHRRILVERIQREIDLCTSAEESIIGALSGSQSSAGVGKLFAIEPCVPTNH